MYMFTLPSYTHVILFILLFFIVLDIDHVNLIGGMKRKLCVAIALIGTPDILVLDEPCAGLDPLSRRNLRNLIMASSVDRAIVLTTHSMVGYICCVVLCTHAVVRRYVLLLMVN